MGRTERNDRSRQGEGVGAEKCRYGREIGVVARVGQGEGAGAGSEHFWKTNSSSSTGRTRRRGRSRI